MSGGRAKTKVHRADSALPDQGGRQIPGDLKNLASAPTHEAIRVRAYQIYEQRGRVEGHALNDWLTAEAQIVGDQ